MKTAAFQFSQSRSELSFPLPLRVGRKARAILIVWLITHSLVNVMGAEAAGFDYPFGPSNGQPRCSGTAQCSGGWQNVQDFRQNNHLGEDWNFGFGSDDLGKPVYAIAGGEVVFAEDVGGDGSWGGVIIILHTGANLRLLGGGTVGQVKSMCAHLDPVNINDWVQVGSIVTRGQQIGVIGPTTTGSSGPHLHFEIRTNLSIELGPGYRADATGWIDPSDFIDVNRPAPSLTVTVPGTSDPWLAGMPDGSTASLEDVAPAQAPVEVLGVPVSAGAAFEFLAFGSVNNVPCPSDSGPDGSSIFGHDTGGENGIADVVAPINSLVGVFLGPSRPDSSPAPATLNFASGDERDYAVLTPAVKQVFFIGDGLASSGATQRVVVPDGATRLFLGTMDGYGWWNNYGAFVVRMWSRPKCAAMPTGIQWVTSPFFSPRPAGQAVDSIVIHTTEGTCSSAIQWFQNNPDHVSAHFVICPNGQITQMVAVQNTSHHATYYNPRSIGIEVAGFADDPATWNPQNLAALEELVAWLVTQYSIPIQHPAGNAVSYPNCRYNEPGLVGHSQVQPDPCTGYTVKTDPGPYFPWASFVENVRTKTYCLPRVGFVRVAGNRLVFSWPTNLMGLVLESSVALGPAASWEPVSPSPVVVNGQYTVTNTISGGTKFFRLRR